MAGVGSWRRGLLAAVFLAAGAAGTSAQVSIFRPKIGVPEFALTGGTFRIEIEAASGLASNGWSVVVTHDLRGWTCAVERVEYGNYVYCDSLPGYRVTARAPGDIAPEVFNLVVGHTAAGGATNRHCVSILRYFETNFYILHYADPQAETDAATAANGAGGSHGSIQAIQWAACAFNLINPRFMFNTGDEVENGVAGYYPKYMDAVDAFTVPLLVTRGNNDAGYAFDSWKRDIGQPTYSITMGSFYVCMKDYNANEHLAWFTNDYAGSFTNTQISFRLFGQHFVGAGSAYNPPAGQYPDLMLVGHNHTFATLATSPYYILSSGPGWDYGVVGIFEFFKSGSGWTCSNKTIHGGANKLPVYGDWGAPRKVTNTFLRANDGTAGTNTAYITNSLAYDFWDGRVRFLMRKSAAGYTVTGGEKIAEYDYNGGTNTAVLVKVNIARQARTTVTVSDAPPDTTPPDLAIRFPTNAPVFRTGQSNILIAGTAADNSGITAVTFQVTGARVMSGAALTGPVTLIPAGAIWKYLDDGTDQGTAWRAPDFDDSTWSAGPAELGYGDGDEATVVSYGPYSTNKYITTYFRAVFLNPGPAVLTNALALRVNRDDGVVVYADGMEVFRDNLPAGPVTYLTPASSTSGEGQWFGANLACPTGAT
jgi:hypothetical protein